VESGGVPVESSGVRWSPAPVESCPIPPDSAESAESDRNGGGTNKYCVVPGLVFAGSVDRTEKKDQNRTERNRNRPDQRLCRSRDFSVAGCGA
jgi:hypothetical protein